MGRITRRDVLVGAAVAGVGVGVDHLAANTPARSAAGTVSGSSRVVSFYGVHQSGIGTAAQDYMYFGAFDLRSDAVDDLRNVLELWTAAGARMTAGLPYQPAPEVLDEPPIDTGEAAGLGPARLTVTVGLGPAVFGSPGADRFGLAHVRPPELGELPLFQGDDLDPSSSGGDLCVQACADDPQVAFHAVHVLARLASTAATLRYTQQGFGRTSSTSRTQLTARNLMGFKDGTANIRSEDTQAMNEYVWVQREDGPAWMTAGSYLITRRIRILFDVWDASTLEEQQRTVGREKLSGAPLGTQAEYDPLDLDATNQNGEPLIPLDAHVRLASPEVNSGQQILRRGYSYSEAPEPGSGQIDAGLFFIAFQRSPTRQFIPIQRRLAGSDALNRHTLHTSSAIFACPPAARGSGGFIGEGLFV
jgi:deferrochelatase/peroxidase EfeB